MIDATRRVISITTPSMFPRISLFQYRATWNPWLSSHAVRRSSRPLSVAC